MEVRGNGWADLTEMAIRVLLRLVRLGILFILQQKETHIFTRHTTILAEIPELLLHLSVFLRLASLKIRKTSSFICLFIFTTPARCRIWICSCITRWGR